MAFKTLQIVIWNEQNRLILCKYLCIKHLNRNNLWSEAGNYEFSKSEKSEMGRWLKGFSGKMLPSIGEEVCGKWAKPRKNEYYSERWKNRKIIIDFYKNWARIRCVVQTRSCCVLLVQRLVSIYPKLLNFVSKNWQFDCIRSL